MKLRSEAKGRRRNCCETQACLYAASLGDDSQNYFSALSGSDSVITRQKPENRNCKKIYHDFRAICAVIPPNDSWPKLKWKILFTPQKETGVSRQKKETERFRNIDHTKNGGLGMRKPEKS
jgi:hypothetical protein